MNTQQKLNVYFLIIMIVLMGSSTYSVFGAIRLSPLKNHAVERKIVNHKIRKIKKEISTIALQLGQKNAQYARQMEQIQIVDGEISQMNQQLMESTKQLNKKKDDLKKILMGAALSSVQENTNSERVLQKEALKKMASKYLSQINENIKINEGIQKEIDVLKTRLFEYSEMADQLAKIINELKNKDKIQDPSPVKVTSQVAASVPVGQFNLPFKVYSSISKENKGFSFSVSNNQAILSSAEGVVAYTGDLSTYGKIIIIQHNNNLKTLVLGDLIPEVKKGQNCMRGDIIGHVNQDKRKKSNYAQVYFEIRKENIAQDASQWFKEKL